MKLYKGRMIKHTCMDRELLRAHNLTNVKRNFFNISTILVFNHMKKLKRFKVFDLVTIFKVKRVVSKAVS